MINGISRERNAWDPSSNDDGGVSSDPAALHPRFQTSPTFHVVPMKGKKRELITKKLKKKKKTLRTLRCDTTCCRQCCAAPHPHLTGSLTHTHTHVHTWGIKSNKSTAGIRKYFIGPHYTLSFTKIGATRIGGSIACCFSSVHF